MVESLRKLLQEPSFEGFAHHLIIRIVLDQLMRLLELFLQVDG